jgi:polysaccharide export outer membrane protein
VRGKTFPRIVTSIHESCIDMGASRVIAAWLCSLIMAGSGEALAADADTSMAGLAATSRPEEPGKLGAGASSQETYELQAGDVLDISVWKEADLTREVLVRPDGSFSFPLAGEIDARGKTVENVRAILVDRLQKYVPSPAVAVAVKQIGGNRIYVVGKVNKAGDFPLTNPLDVMQAISLAGGVTPYAAVNHIVILRRQNGQQKLLRFRYSDVARGRALDQNIQLQSGDTVVVP